MANVVDQFMIPTLRTPCIVGLLVRPPDGKINFQRTFPEFTEIEFCATTWYQRHE